MNAPSFRAILDAGLMPQPRSLSLELVRTDGWFERVGQTVSSFQALCDILGEHFFAFSLITGVRITALTVDRRHPENTLVDFTVAGGDGGEATERLPLADFQRRLVTALLVEAQHGPAPQREQDAEAIQQFIGPQYLLLAPLYGLTLSEIGFENGEPAIRYEHDGVEHEVALEDFRSNLRERVRAELSLVARQESRNAIDLGHVAQADALFAKRDYVGVKDLLGTWPAALTIFLRTPEAQALQAETRGTLAHALGLLGSACSALVMRRRRKRSCGWLFSTRGIRRSPPRSTSASAPRCWRSGARRGDRAAAAGSDVGGDLGLAPSFRGISRARALPRRAGRRGRGASRGGRGGRPGGRAAPRRGAFRGTPRALAGSDRQELRLIGRTRGRRVAPTGLRRWPPGSLIRRPDAPIVSRSILAGLRSCRSGGSRAARLLVVKPSA